MAQAYTEMGSVLWLLHDVDANEASDNEAAGEKQ